MESVEGMVMRLEQELLLPHVRASIQRLDELLADDFHEVGAAGHSFGRAEVLARLPHERGVGFLASDMQAYLLAPTVALVTYSARRTHEGGATHSRRSSVWVRNVGGWQMRYHQGTDAQASPHDDPSEPTRLQGAA